MTRAILAGTAVLAVFVTTAATAQVPSPPNTVVETESNQVGGGADRVIAREPTGAGTVETNSADGGNAGQPSRRVPQGSGSGGGGNN